MLRVKIFPAVDFWVAYIQTRGFLIVDNKPNILHYTGTNEKELRDLLKEDKPDLLVMNSRFFPLSDLNVFWVYHLVRSYKELYRTRKIYTNNFRLCQLYFQRLGLQAEIGLIQKPTKPAESVREIKFASPSSFFKTLWAKLCVIMDWE